MTFLVLLLVVSFHVVALSEWNHAKEKKKKKNLKCYSVMKEEMPVFWVLSFTHPWSLEGSHVKPSSKLHVTLVAQKMPIALIWKLLQGEIFS